MTRIFLKNKPKLRLGDILRRRKMTLQHFLSEFGITTYDGLAIRCDRMGVQPPSVEEFKAASPAVPVNNPMEGVVVVEPPPVIDDLTGRRIDPDAPVLPEVKVVFDANEEANEPSAQPTDASQKKLRKKKEPT